MMITIHGLPPKSKYQDVKALIKQECKITDFILDNLVAEPNGCKKVRVGLTDDDEGYRIMKCLDGYRCSGNFVLSVLPVGKTAPPNAPMQNTYDSRGTFQSQPRNDYPPAANYGNQAPQGPHRSMDMPSRPAQWNANHQSNQWNPSLSVQVPQNTFGYQQNPTPVHQNQPYQQQHASQGVRPDIRPVPQVRGPPEQSFGFSNKSNVPDLRGARQDGRPHVLRSVEILDVPANPAVQVQGRYPPNNQSFQAQEKPGPSPYMAAGTQPQGHFQGQGHAPHPGYGPNQGHAPIQPWVQPQAQVLKQPFPKPTPRQYDKPYHDERKYPQTENRTDMKSNEAARISHDSYKKYDSSGRPFSPQRMDPTRRHSPPGRPIIPSDVRISPPGRRISPSGRGISAPGRRVSPSGRRISPPGRRISPSVRRISPPGRRISPPGRRISPPGRRISPPSRVISATDRNTSLSGRPISPTGRGISGSGRLVSPPGRRASPPGRVISPSGRRLSPSDKRMAGRGSPERRLVSPTRRDPQRSTMPMRFSPSRHQDKSSDKYGNDIQKLKQVRPAYEPTTQAPNQSMYSGGYRPNISDVQYPITGPRQVEQSSWQQERDKAMYSSTMKKLEEERRDISRAQVRGGDQAVVSPRASRSPLRRDRSPIRDRFKRHSPSPRSPRRSWALEKRRSPEVEEAPPPPIWPGQSRDDDFPRHARPEFTPRVDKDEKKHVIPPWERPNFDKEDDRARRPVIEEMRPYGDERVRRNIPDREPARTDRFPIQNPKVPEYNREEFERERRGDFRRQSDVDRKPYVEKRDFRDLPRQADREDHHRLEPVPLRRDSPVVELGRKDFGKEIDRDFEDIYKKALEFKKRAEELRKSGEKKREVFSGEERSRRDDDSKYYENRRETESRYQDNRDDRHDYRTEAERHIHRPENSPERPLPTVDHYKRDDALQRTKRFLMPPAVKVKRDKAVEDLSKKIMDKHLDSNLTPDQKLRIREELRLALARILFEMFGDMDVSFIEIVIKYQAKYNEKDEHKILRDVMSSMPSMYRNSLKRPATESSAISPKSSRWSPPPDVKKDEPSRQALNDSVRSRSGVYYANQQSRKEYEDYKKDVTFRPKPQRPYQRVIEESNPEYRTRSSGQSELRPKMRHEANVKPRIRPEYKMRPESEEEVERARHQQMNSSENKTDHRAKFDTKPKTRQEVYSERKVRHETYTEPERKLKPEIRENPEVIRAEKKDRPENKLKTDIIRSDQMAKRVNTEPKEKPEIVCQQKVEEKVIAPLATIDEGATPIEDIIEEQLPVAKPTGQHYELNPLMSRMVEVELRDIMIKIWQELPDNSLDEGEKLVADKLRNIAGDDIRNVLGLNVTKRLLNVFNPLFVKIQFSGKPDRVNLAKFLRKYNFIAFKRIGKADVFAAQMKSIKDFDRICSTIDIMCGDVKVTVNPCYRFTKCPPNLKTSYDDKSEADVIDDTADPEKHKQGSYTDVTVPKLKSQQNTAESNIGKTVPSLAKSVNVCQTKQSETNGAKMKVDTKSDGTAEPKIIQSETDCKTVPIINSEKNVPKINPAKSGTNVVKPSPAKPDKNVATSNTEKAKVETKIDSQNKSNEVNNKNKLNESKVPDGSGDGNETVHDELDEADMFALISEGIVLDECSGSDEE